MGVHTFPKGICPKVNVIVQLEYKYVCIYECMYEYSRPILDNISF